MDRSPIARSESADGELAQGHPRHGEAGAEAASPAPDDWLLWQVIDSAFPIGGFAHSSGLEAAWQHGEIRHRDALMLFLDASLEQLGHAALPFVTAAFAAPERVTEWDAHCEAFLTNHVANRASRAQGRALLAVVERVFKKQPATQDAGLAFAHFAPVFGASLRRLGVGRETATRLFFFNHLRGLLAAAVRLNIVGPMEAQALQHHGAPRAEAIRRRCESLSLDDLAQTAPLLEIWQGAQDRLYSRLFQS